MTASNGQHRSLSRSTLANKINADFHFETYAPREFRTAAAKKECRTAEFSSVPTCATVAERAAARHRPSS